MTAIPRRVVTGHDAAGRSVFASDGPTPASTAVGDGVAFHELWNTAGAPTPITASEPEPTDRELLVGPPRHGSVLRIVDLPPGASGPMHRTASIDYGIVLFGEIHLVLDADETKLGPGDIVVQRGTDHAWQNRSAAPARIAFVLLDGSFDPSLAAALPPGALDRLMTNPPAAGSDRPA